MVSKIEVGINRAWKESRKEDSVEKIQAGEFKKGKLSIKVGPEKEVE